MTAETPLTPVLSQFWDDSEVVDAGDVPRARRLSGVGQGAHDGARHGSSEVKDSGLRGRGGAGFGTGMKWGFIPQDSSGTGAKPHYLVINADESEPGTCKDIPLMFMTPHFLVEGAIIAAYAIRASHAFIYVRGEVVPVLRRLRAAVAEAYEAGYVGRDILGSGFDLDIVVHAGAGAYICGEETALLDSLEGRRGQPRLRPPFPAVSGLYACPTVVNNVESIASVPPIILNGVDWFRSMGSEKSPGFTLYSLSGHVTRPGQYEAPLGITLRELLDYAGGVRAGHQLKFWTPGGSSTPILTDEHLDVPLDYEGVGAAGSMLGTKALQIFDETTCVVRAVRAGPSSTSTSPAASAHRAGRAPTGWRRSTSGWRPVTAPRPTSRSCSTSPTRSSESRSARWAMVRPCRSCRRSSISATSTSPMSSSKGARSIRATRCSSRPKEQRYDGDGRSVMQSLTSRW